jgi:O-antigen ligase
MRSSALKRLAKLELIGLYALLFSLPLMESPKHFAIVLFSIGALGWRFLQKPIGWRRPDTFEWLLISMWAISLASTLANWPMEPGIRGLINFSCILFLFWAMYRNTYNETQVRLAIWILVAAVMLGLIEGIWEWKSGIRGQLEFHSAGIVTQSAIYLGISIFLMFGILLDNVSSFTTFVRAAMAMCLLFSLSCLFIMGSRGSVLAVIVTTGLLSLKLFRNKRFRLVLGIGLSISGIIVIGAHVAAKDSILIERIKHLTSNVSIHGIKLDNTSGPNDRLRFDHWLVGYAQATQGGHMLLGIGPRNFPSIKVDQLRFSKPLATYPSVWQVPDHAHNLFLTKWCEEGILGLTAFILFLSLIAAHLFRYRPMSENIHWTWIACLGALMMPIVAGSFNSSFTNEFAWLSMLLMGLSMAKMKKEGEVRAENH